MIVQDQPQHKQLWSYVILVLLLLLALVVVWYVFYVEQASSPVTQPLPAQTSNTTQDQYQLSHTALIYFSLHPQSDDDPGKTFSVPRTSPGNNLATFALGELLKGPSVGEQADGYFSTARIRSPAESSTCGGQDFSLTIKDTVATLTFCRTFDHVGEISDGQAESEIKATLLQFPTIKKVIILNSKGDCEFNLSGQNLCKQ